MRRLGKSLVSSRLFSIDKKKRAVVRTQEERAESELRLEEAAELLKDDYKRGSELVEFTEALEGDDFYEYTDEDIEKNIEASERSNEKTPRKTSK
jgi:hypothetical protein